MDYRELIELKNEHARKARSLVDWYAGRVMPEDVVKTVESHTNTIKALELKIADAEPQYRRPMGDEGKVYSGDGRVVGHDPDRLARKDRLTKDESVAAWMEAKGLLGSVSEAARHASLGLYLKGMATGDWCGAEAEQELYVKTMNEGTASAGGNIVPTPLSGHLIDLARNKSLVMRVGATVVPMTTSTLKIPRLIGESAPGWRNENASIAATADLSFDAVTFTARSLNRLVTLSQELLEDSDPAAGGVITDSFAQQIALEVDRAALRGSGTAPEPRGVLNQSGITTTSHGANGTNLSNYDWFLDAAGSVRAANFEPTAHLVAPRTRTNLGKLKQATTNAYLDAPGDLLPMGTTNQIPTNLTVGTSNDCSEVYTGQWDQLLVGIRTELRIDFLRQRYADNGQVAFLAWFRGDVQLAHPAAFVVDTGVRP